MISLFFVVIIIDIAICYKFIPYQSRKLTDDRFKLSASSFDKINKQMTSGLQDIVAKDIPESFDYSDLPDSFDDMVKQAASRVISCILSGSMRVRVDIDTSVGDLTYTSIKNTLPILKELVKELSTGFDLSLPIPPSPKFEEHNDIKNDDETTTESMITTSTSNTSSIAITEEMLLETMKNTFYPDRTLRIFFPDMGAAALARRDWKLGSALPEVPPCVFTGNIQNDPLLDTDKLAIILCPRYSETEYVKRVMDMCDEKAIPCVLLNPELINMDQGVRRARNIRKAILGTFKIAYKLTTLKEGAIVRVWPRGFTVWVEDDAKDEGYTLLKCFAEEPPRETVEELFMEVEEKRGKKQTIKPNAAVNVVNEVVGFFKGLSKL